MTAPGRALVAGVDPRVAAAAVLACPGVVRLSGGAFGAAGTYLPGGRVTGVVVREASDGGLPDIAVHVVSLVGVPVAEVAQQVRTALTAAAPGSRVDVHVEDVDVAAPDPVEEPADVVPTGVVPADVVPADVVLTEDDVRAARQDPLVPPARSATTED